jgi:GNAT superfamily N-acetyltransferase
VRETSATRRPTGDVTAARGPAATRPGCSGQSGLGWNTFGVPCVERLDPTSWERLRRIRLRALDDAPDAFGSSAASEGDRDQATWQRLVVLGPWWLAVEEGDDVGMVAGGHREGDDRTRWVYSMWVERPWRGRDVAGALLDAVVDWARSDGASLLGLDVTNRVPRARRFYERYGFVATGVVVPLPRDPSIELAEMTYALVGDGR